MKVGVLGSTGFVGTNVCDYLSKHSIDYVGASRSLGVDATDPDQLIGWIRHHNVTHVVNLAADCGGIGLNKRSPARLWLATQRIGSAVLVACAECKVEKLIQVGTVCSYAADCPTPFKEEYLMSYGPPEPTNRAYGVAKLSTLYGAQAFHKQHGLNVCNLLPVNMYGRHDNFGLLDSHVIPAVIHKVHVARGSVSMWGTGKATREFLHASDFAQAVALSLFCRDKRANDGTFINVGTGTSISIEDLVHLIIKLSGKELDVVWDSSMPDGQMRRELDITRAREILGYSPAIGLEEGLRDVIRFWKATDADHAPV